MVEFLSQLGGRVNITHTPVVSLSLTLAWLISQFQRLRIIKLLIDVSFFLAITHSFQRWTTEMTNHAIDYWCFTFFFLQSPIFIKGGRQRWRIIWRLLWWSSRLFLLVLVTTTQQCKFVIVYSLIVPWHLTKITNPYLYS